MASDAKDLDTSISAGSSSPFAPIRLVSPPTPPRSSSLRNASPPHSSTRPTLLDLLDAELADPTRSRQRDGRSRASSDGSRDGAPTIQVSTDPVAAPARAEPLDVTAQEPERIVNRFGSFRSHRPASSLPGASKTRTPFLGRSISSSGGAKDGTNGSKAKLAGQRDRKGAVGMVKNAMGLARNVSKRLLSGSVKGKGRVKTGYEATHSIEALRTNPVRTAAPKPSSNRTIDRPRPLRRLTRTSANVAILDEIDTFEELEWEDDGTDAGVGAIPTYVSRRRQRPGFIRASAPSPTSSLSSSRFSDAASPSPPLSSPRQPDAPRLSLVSLFPSLSISAKRGKDIFGSFPSSPRRSRSTDSDAFEDADESFQCRGLGEDFPPSSDSSITSPLSNHCDLASAFSRRPRDDDEVRSTRTRCSLLMPTASTSVPPSPFSVDKLDLVKSSTSDGARDVVREGRNSSGAEVGELTRFLEELLVDQVRAGDVSPAVVASPSGSRDESVLDNNDDDDDDVASNAVASTFEFSEPEPEEAEAGTSDEEEEEPVSILSASRETFCRPGPGLVKKCSVSSLRQVTSSIPGEASSSRRKVSPLSSASSSQDQFRPSTPPVDDSPTASLQSPRRLARVASSSSSPSSSSGDLSSPSPSSPARFGRSVQVHQPLKPEYTTAPSTPFSPVETLPKRRFANLSFRSPGPKPSPQPSRTPPSPFLRHPARVPGPPSEPSLSQVDRSRRREASLVEESPSKRASTIRSRTGKKLDRFLFWHDRDDERFGERLNAFDDETAEGAVPDKENRAERITTRRRVGRGREHTVDLEELGDYRRL
ncbi:hypothetical protein JCM10212_003073 [Sporobolomyces blumeae]